MFVDAHEPTVVMGHSDRSRQGIVRAAENSASSKSPTFARRRS